MKADRSVKFLLVLIALLLTANLVRPILAPSAVYAEDKKEHVDSAITGAGTTAWVLRGNQVFYMKFEQQFESIRVYGPEELED